MNRSCVVTALAAFSTLVGSAVVRAQSVSVTPSQVYVVESQETFVTLQGTNLVGTSSTLVDFVSASGQLWELEPNTAVAAQLEVWIPLEVTYAVGNYTITVKAIDAGGGTRTIGPVSFSVTQRGTNAAPLLSLPEVITSDPNTTGGAYVTFDAGGANCDHTSGSFFPYGTTTVTCTSSNAFGTTAGTFSVVVGPPPGTPPILTLPEVVTAEATSASGATVAFDAGGASCDRASGSLFPLATTPVTCTATNAYGTSTGRFLVVVTDTVAPTLSVPANITSGNPVVTYTATASDAIDGALVPVCTPPSGSQFVNGATIVECVATDNHANSSSGWFTVTIVAATLNDFTASQNVYQLNAANGATVIYTSNVPVALTETLTIWSVATGQTVRTLVNAARSPGVFQDAWDGKNDSGQLVPDGLYRYLVTVTANGATFTWDDGTRYAGTTQTQLPYPKCRTDAGALVDCGDPALRFDPYANQPLRVNYCVGTGTPPNCTTDTPYFVIGKAVNVGETDVTCGGSDCFLSEYQAGGAHETLWYGRSIDGTFLGNATRLTVIRRNDTWPRNLTLVHGTAPEVSSVVVSWPLFNPAGSPEEFRLTVVTFQSRTITIKAELKNLTSGSVLRTITTPPQAAGAVVVAWNGRADNGAWVAPGLYEALITITDAAGNTVVLKPLLTVRYE